MAEWLTLKECIGSNPVRTTKIKFMMYDNIENIGPNEILRKMHSLGHGPNRNKRFDILYSYSTNLITKEEWIRKYCIK